MAKFNLKKILMKKFEVSLLDATNFEQWVGKNLDYEAVMEKDFKSISFKSVKVTTEAFLEEINKKVEGMEIPKSISDVLDKVRVQEVNKNEELYDKIRKLESELKELKDENLNKTKRIADLTIEVEQKQEDEFLKAIKPILSKFSLKLGEKDVDSTTKGVRRKFVEDLEFMRSNRHFLSACITFKKVGFVDKKTEEKLEVKAEEVVVEVNEEWHYYNINDLIAMEKVEGFYHYTYNGKDRFSGAQASFQFNYGSASTKLIANSLGIKYKVLPNNGKIYFKVTKEEFLKIYNEKTPKRNVLGELIQTESNKPEQKSFREVLNEVGTI